MAVADALCLAQPDSVNDAGVVEFITEDGICLARNHLKQGGIRVKTGGVEDGIRTAMEAGNCLLQTAVNVLWKGKRKIKALDVDL
jgi:hypothetical protein